MFAKLMYCKHLYRLLSYFVVTIKPHPALSEGEGSKFMV
jgi:hypothetical protein